jgi:hypothetical protein
MCPASKLTLTSIPTNPGGGALPTALAPSACYLFDKEHINGKQATDESLIGRFSLN